MASRKIRLTVAASAGAVVAAALTAAPSAAASSASGASGAETKGRYVLIAKSPGELAGLRAEAERQGAQVVREVGELNMVVVRTTGAVKARLKADPRARAVAKDGVVSVSQVDRTAPNLTAPGLRGARPVAEPGVAAAEATPGGRVNPDPAYDYPGLLWDFNRMDVPQGWRTTAGAETITVGVADTGLDFTHKDLAPNIVDVVDLSDDLCKTEFGFSDGDLAKEFGGPARTDWNGHGSHVGGTIASALNGTGMNGIAPKVNLVALKIAQWCGSTPDSTLLAAFIYAANHGIDVVNISFGGYSDRRDPEQEAIWQAYTDAVAYAKRKGTTIVASSGNEHLRINEEGRVVSHGPLTTPGTKRADFVDYFGLYESPGGVPGVVNVSATGNVVAASLGNCTPGSIGTPEDFNAVCKPASDRHQAAGKGERDQLAYYSNYGPGIDLAAPGGARKFNLPNYDRGGTPGFPYTSSDLTTTFEIFSTTSNWAVSVPCFTFTRSFRFPLGQCYSSIQGTSMAAPHAAAAVALAASAHPNLRGDVNALVAHVKQDAVPRHNETRALSATDKSPGDLTGLPCPTGFCHLSGPRISDRDAYGAGLVNVRRP